MEENKGMNFKVVWILIGITILLGIGVIAALLILSRPQNNSLEVSTIDSNSVINDSNTTEDVVKIRYAFSYDLVTAEELNESEKNFIDILEINLEGKELEKVVKLLENQTFEKMNNVDSIVLSSYEISVNEDIKIVFSSGTQTAEIYNKNSSYITTITQELSDEIVAIVEKEAQKYYEKFTANKIIITPTKSDEVTVSSVEDIQDIIEGIKCVKINTQKDLSEDEEIEYILDFENGVKLITYKDSNVGKIEKESENYYIAFVKDYEDTIAEIINK